MFLLLDDSANTSESVDNAVENFSKLFFDYAFSQISVNSSYPCNRHFSSDKQNAWYNDSCRNAKRKFSEASSNIRKINQKKEN